MHQNNSLKFKIQHFFFFLDANKTECNIKHMIQIKALQLFLLVEMGQLAVGKVLGQTCCTVCTRKTNWAERTHPGRVRWVVPTGTISSDFPQNLFLHLTSTNVKVQVKATATISHRQMCQHSSTLPESKVFGLSVASWDGRMMADLQIEKNDF